MKVQQQIREAVFQTPKVLQFEVLLRESCRKVKRPQKSKEDNTLETLVFSFSDRVYFSVMPNFSK